MPTDDTVRPENILETQNIHGWRQCSTPFAFNYRWSGHLGRLSVVSFNP